MIKSCRIRLRVEDVVMPVGAGSLFCVSHCTLDDFKNLWGGGEDY